MKRKLALILITLALLIVASACGDKDSDQTDLNNNEQAESDNNQIDTSYDIKYETKDFLNQPLEEVYIPNRVEVSNELMVDDIKQVLYYDTQSAEDSIYSYITVGDTEYYLGKTIYYKGGEDLTNSPVMLKKANLDSVRNIYKFEEVKGASLMRTSYLVIDNGIPTIIYTVDGFTDERDLDNDGKIETYSEYGTPGSQTTIHKWDFVNKKVDYVYLNKAIFNESPSVHIDNSSQIIVTVDGVEKKYTIKDDKVQEVK